MAGSMALGDPSRPLHVAIVGSGPSGFYAAQALVRTKELTCRVDIFDRLPTPFGLVRGGVAPDHQNIKRVVRGYEKVAKADNVRFFGNVQLGRDVQVADLEAHYDAIIYATGNESSRKLGIPGEDLDGVHSATEFVFWYNSHPDYQDRTFDLAGSKRVAVIGNGNVSMDVTRVIAQMPAGLETSDISETALEALRGSAVEEVVVLGRRGPAQAAFSPQEIQDLGSLSDVDLVIYPTELTLDPLTKAWLESADAPKTAQKNLTILNEVAQRTIGVGSRRISCRFLVSPVALLGESGRLTGIRLQKNELVERNGTPRPTPVGEPWDEPIDLVFKAIGYRGTPIPGVPFHERWGLIPNESGRVTDPETDAHKAGHYVVGWAKRGPSGLIGTNKPDSQATVTALLDDLRGQATDASRGDIQALLGERGVRYVTFADWKRLDAAELAAGEARGKVRHKFTDIADMLATLDG